MVMRFGVKTYNLHGMVASTPGNTAGPEKGEWTDYRCAADSGGVSYAGMSPGGWHYAMHHRQAFVLRPEDRATVEKRYAKMQSVKRFAAFLKELKLAAVAWCKVLFFTLLRSPERLASIEGRLGALEGAPHRHRKL